MYRRKKSSSRNFKRKPIRKTSFKKKSMRKFVKRVIKSTAEKKNCVFRASKTVGYVTSGTGIVSISDLLPYASGVLVQGTGQGDRIGNKITFVSGRLNLFIYPAVYNATSNPFPTPQIMRIFIGYRKSQPTVAPTTFTDLFQLGNTSVGITSTPDNMTLEVNKDAFMIYYDKLVKIGYAVTNGSGASGADQGWANNDFKLNHIVKIPLSKFYPKKLTFNDGTTTVEQPGRYMWCIVQAATNNTTSSTSVIVDWNQTMFFTDD